MNRGGSRSSTTGLHGLWPEKNPRDALAQEDVEDPEDKGEKTEDRRHRTYAGPVHVLVLDSARFETSRAHQSNPPHRGKQLKNTPRNLTLLVPAAMFLSLVLSFLFVFSVFAEEDKTSAPGQVEITMESEFLVSDAAKRLRTEKRLERLFALPQPDDAKQGWREQEWLTFRFQLEKAQFVLRHYSDTPNVSTYVERQLSEAETLYASIAAGNPAAARRIGLREEAYRADNDGSLQPFVRFLPQTYSPDTKYPLLVYLHGYSPYLNIANWSLPCEGLVEFADSVNACMVMPFGRSNTDFQGIGEQDVLRVIREMTLRYSIDPDRIFLVGFSMGGMGAWTIAAHFPYLFAGAIIISGRADYYFWHKLERKQLSSPKRELIDREFGAGLLENLAHLPILSFHGTADRLIPVGEARHMASLMKQVSPEFRHHEFPDQDHWITELVFAHSSTKEMIAKRSLTYPETFAYRSWHPFYQRAWWIRIESFGPTPPYQIEVKKIGDKLVVSGKNVEAVSFDRKRMPESIRNAEVEKEGTIRVTETDFGLERIPCPETPWPAGGIRDVFLKPFAFVDASAADEIGEPAATRIRKWADFAKGQARIRKETDLTDEEKRSWNLYVCGEPETSPLVAELLKTATIRIDGDHYLVADKKFPRTGNGILLMMRSPWNPEREIVVECGAPWGGHAPVNHLYDSAPGFIVYSERRDPSDPDGGNLPLCSGFLDRNGHPVRVHIEKPQENQK
jgi:predicted esterase